MKKIAKVKLTDYKSSVYKALEDIKAAPVLSKQKRIIIKPNLVTSAPPPATTNVAMIDVLVDYIKEKSNAEIIVAEGSGGCDTDVAYEKLGYNKLKDKGVKLVDLDSEKSIIKLTKDMPLLKEIFLPSMILDGFLISAPCLKQHTMTSVSLGIKNLVGILPRKHYQGFWVFRKSKIHKYNVHQGVADICFYRPIDLTIIDGAIGYNKGHLLGKPFDPPKEIIVAGFDVLETDIVAAEIIDKNPKKVKHFRCYKCNLDRV